MGTLLIVLCVIVFLLAIVLFSPVVIAVDSRSRQLRIRWLSVLEFQMPLPGTVGQKRFTIFRKTVPIRERNPAAEAAGVKKEKPAKAATAAPKLRKKRRKRGEFLMRCLGDSAIRGTLARQLWKLLKRVCGSVAFSGSASDISLPDPALNGMLAGALAASEWAQRSGVRVNFLGENNLFLEVRFLPHRVFKAVLLFMSALPYRAMFREWRALSAASAQ
ncbi:MAG: hypothetical protein P8Z30_07440 [Acidobacteriota bacterium]